MEQDKRGSARWQRTCKRTGAIAVALIALCATEGQARAEPPEQKETQTTSTDGTLAALTYGGFAAAGVGVLVGTISGIMAVSRTSQLKSDCPGSVCAPNRQNDIDSARNLAGLSTVSFAIALIGAAVGFNGMMLWNDAKEKQQEPPPASAAVRIRPILGVGAAGLQGSF